MGASCIGIRYVGVSVGTLLCMGVICINDALGVASRALVVAMRVLGMRKQRSFCVSYVKER